MKPNPTFRARDREIARAWDNIAAPDVPAIGECCFCPRRYLAFQSGVNARGRPVFMCAECRMNLIEMERRPSARAAGQPAAAGKARVFSVAKGAS